jgi:hypothetical protein
VKILERRVLMRRFGSKRDRVHRLFGPVVRDHGYRTRGTGFDSRRYHIFWELVDMERVPLSEVRITEELLE